jgi:hypothetical protein
VGRRLTVEVVEWLFRSRGGRRTASNGRNGWRTYSRSGGVAVHEQEKKNCIIRI